ncbi:MAG: alanine--tRNA ligase [Nitrospinota bacterium]
MVNVKSGNEIRQAFIDYFSSKKHRFVRSSNLVPAADPTLLFTNAGMVPFKDVFLGREKRDYKRAVSSQKCLRVSGKHNDLEEVGRTDRHNTFFEMLGNFSFGDYFKEEAIVYAWEFLTVTMGLPADKLWITIFNDDEESGKLWMKAASVSADRIKALGEEDNFWSMGPTGPCGPCSEIYIDNGKERGCGKPGCGPGCDCERYEELWNLVFMQYNRTESGKLEPLPKPNIDTGMGLERLASVIQGVTSNFDTDLIRPIIARAEDVLQKPCGVTTEDDVSLRVIGDHIRAAAFLITEGILPSNDDRGYVLRRIMRRAMRHGKMLGASEPFLYKVVGSVIDEFKEPYPELREAEPTMAKIIKVEEQRFARTLEAGLRILNEIVEKAKAENRKNVEGGEIFKLYDTYGFPIDLAEDVLNDAGLGYDRNGFESELESQRDKARKSFKTVDTKVLPVYETLKDETVTFVGYGNLEEGSSVTAIIQDEKRVDSINKGISGEIVLAETPFYAESGGQVGDIGVLVSQTGTARVENTKKVMDRLVIHLITVIDGVLKEGQVVTAKVNRNARLSTMRNHSATHLLQAALRQVLGEHVKQSGSLVEGRRLRFDFSHYAPMTDEEIREVEEIVNEKIREDIELQTTEMDLEKALDGGATALFGEKYGSSVRVVKMSDFSKELCGGTHVCRTGEIGLFKITQETGVAAGIRRVEAITGELAFRYVRLHEDRLNEIAQLVKRHPDDCVEGVQKLVEKTKELEKEIKKLKSQKARGSDGAESKEQIIDGIKVISSRLEELDNSSLRSYVDEMKQKIKSGVVLAGSVNEGKAALIAGVTKDITGKVKAGDIIREAASYVGGGGGGRPDMAQAGGPNVDGLDDALKSVYTFVEKALKG